MKFLKLIFLTFALGAEIIAHAQSQSIPKYHFYSIKMVFHSMVGEKLLYLDSDYTTPQGDTFSVSKFKFYIGNIQISCSDYDKTGRQYFLIDQNDSSSQTIQAGTCDSLTEINFNLGVVNPLNTAGVQTGALDPANGMFWTWNTGYINAKLEGKSPQSKAPFSNITYHIGGITKKISLPIKITDLSILKHFQQPAADEIREITIHISVDLNKWFDGPHPIKIANESYCMSPGKMATEIADNYANMFSIKSISVQ